MASARNARKALARGATDEALVLLWNEIEPARLDGDVATLREISVLAEQIRRTGDPAQQREAERMLERLRGPVEDEADAAPATAALEADVELGGTSLGDAGEVAEEEGRGRGGIANLVWVLLFLLIVILNVLRGVGGE